jgi:hypothetical protein
MVLAEVLGIIEMGLGLDESDGLIGEEVGRPVDRPRVETAGSADAYVIKTASHGLETGDDIPEALPVGQLGEGQAKELVKTREPSDPIITLITSDALAELVQREEGHDLGEDGRLGVHRPLLWKTGRKRADYTKTRSNRLRLKSAVSHEISIGCRGFQNHQPDSPGVKPTFFRKK